MRNDTGTIIKRVLFSSYLILIVILSTIDTGRTITQGTDKIEHASAFFVFALLMYWSFTRISGVTIFLTGFVFGLMIEVIQNFLPHRVFDLSDVVANSAGLALGILVILICRRIRRKFQKESDDKEDSEDTE